MSKTILGISLVNGLGGSANIGEVANGGDCFAAQIIKLTFAFCNKTILVDSIPTDTEQRVNTIAWYDCKDMISAYDLELMQTTSSCFAPRTTMPGIHSYFDGKSTLVKSEQGPPRPSVCNKRAANDDDPDQVNKRIKITKYTREDDDEPNIPIGTEGMHLFDMKYGMGKMLRFDSPSYTGELVARQNVTFTYVDDAA